MGTCAKKERKKESTMSVCFVQGYETLEHRFFLVFLITSVLFK